MAHNKDIDPYFSKASQTFTNNFISNDLDISMIAFPFTMIHVQYILEFSYKNMLREYGFQASSGIAAAQ